MEKDTSEIAKLTERISKDPKSKLFVPLAEEYKKIGDIEMAIHVLSEGLKSNPGYVTARSLLGRLLLEKGELAAAQSEFEEVVKAIPDNLLAQRKLGDLHILQNKKEEALKRYKIALTLNPKDAEIASLISDIEGGTDISVVLQSKSKPSPTQEPLPPTSPQAQIPVKITPISAVSPARAEAEATVSLGDVSQPKPGLPESPAEPAKLQETIFAEVSGLGEDIGEEEAEEVLVVEPLEDEVAEVALAESESASLPVLDLEPGPAPGEGEETEKTFAPAEPVPEEASIFLDEPETGEQAALITEGPVTELSAAEKLSEHLEADDFTTDTLAELYIGQGFFEKAIDIYERMLADNPTSRGLKEKLVKVKAMAGSAPEGQTPAASEEIQEPGAPEEPVVFAEAKEYTPPSGGEEEVALDADLFLEPEKDFDKNEQNEKSESDIFTEAREYQPPASEPEGAVEVGMEDQAFTPSRESTPAKPQYVDFEPREYIPPTAKPLTAKPDEGTVTPAARKQTVDRLEAWLSNIKKEK